MTFYCPPRAGDDRGATLHAGDSWKVRPPLSFCCQRYSPYEMWKLLLSLLLFSLTGKILSHPLTVSHVSLASNNPEAVRTTAVGPNGELLINGHPVLILSLNKIWGWQNPQGWLRPDQFPQRLQEAKKAGFNAIMGLNERDPAVWDKYRLYTFMLAAKPFGKPLDPSRIRSLSTAPDLIGWYIEHEFHGASGNYSQWRNDRARIRSVDPYHVVGDLTMSLGGYPKDNNPYRIMDLPLPECTLSEFSPASRISRIFGELRKQEEEWHAGYRFIRALSLTPVAELELIARGSANFPSREEIFRAFLLAVAMNVKVFDVLFGATQNSGALGGSVDVEPYRAEIDRVWYDTLSAVRLVRNLGKVILAPGNFVPIPAIPPLRSPSAETQWNWVGLYAVSKVLPDGSEFIIATNLQDHPIQAILQTRKGTLSLKIPGRSSVYRRLGGYKKSLPLKPSLDGGKRTSTKPAKDYRPSLKREEEKLLSSHPKEYLIGVYYFSGWWEDLPNKYFIQGRDWRENFPERIPLLGAYNDQKTMDQEILTAFHYGIDFFQFLWYPQFHQWEPHQEKLNEGLRLFLASPNNHLLFFTLEYVNHPPFEITSETEWISACREWCRLMRHPQYLRIGGRPLFKIHGLEHFLHQNGNNPQQVAKRLTILRRLAREYGLPNLLIGGGVGIGGVPSKPFVAPYDFLTTYMDVPPLPPKETPYPYPELIRHASLGWKRYAEKSEKPYIPYLPAGWDPRPWKYSSPSFAPPTPQEWRSALQRLKETLDTSPKLGIPLAKGKRQKILLIYAWNEYGEGGYIAPTQGEGVRKLKGIKEVFSPP